MAVTAIWPIRGRLDRAIAYIKDQEKTYNPAWEQGDFPALSSLMQCAMKQAAAQGMGNTINYVTDGEKTDYQYYVSGIRCDPQSAREAMALTKRRFQKEGGIVLFHGYQSFKPGEVTPEQAHEIGVELANRLWGDRFEVVIATHLNTGVLHNHFILNSVSCVDGKRFYANKATYAQMRRVSDDLCRLRGLSVIAQENGRSQHYGQWIAEQAGAPTWRSAIRADVDRAIAQSMTWNAFLSHLERQGYGIKTGVKHTAVRPPGKERFVRLRSLGDAYTEEAIRNRILGQRRPVSPPIRPAQPRRVRIQGSFRLYKITWKGLRALYYHYLILLRKARRQDSPAPFVLREDLRYMQAISRQAQFLHQYAIDTAEQLAVHRADSDGRILLLCRERKQLQNARRHKGLQGERKEGIEARLHAIHGQLKALRAEIRLCDAILIRSVQIKENLKKAKQQETEVLFHEPDGRSSGTNREYGHQRDRERR